MSGSTSVPQPNAIYPLTSFDEQYAASVFLTGWLVKGTIDHLALASALTTLTEKWRMLAGRLESVEPVEELGGILKHRWQLRIPLGALPPEYQTFSLTTETSRLPITHYVTLPIPTVSDALPQALFFHPTTPTSSSAFEATYSPLLHFHITYFEPNAESEDAYTCIGFTRGHGVFDGTGASRIMNALVAEMKKEPWDIPPLPREGLNENILQNAIETARRNGAQGNLDPTYHGCIDLNGWDFLLMASHYFWDIWWRGARKTIVVVPKDVTFQLVDDARAALAREGLGDVRITTGDVLVAWLMKTIYSDDTTLTKTIHCSNLASIRSVLSSPTLPLHDYPHNAFIAMPYPIYTVEELLATPIHTLSHSLALCRMSVSSYHAVYVADMQEKYTYAAPFHPDAQEWLKFVNVSSTRILNTDWAAFGAGPTLCGYRYPILVPKLPFSNSIFVSGRLDDGSTVLDVTLNRTRLRLVVEAIGRLTATSKARHP